MLINYYRLSKPVKKILSTLCKMFTIFEPAKMSSKLTAVLSNNDDDVTIHQLKLWNKNIAVVIEVSFISLNHLVCIAYLLDTQIFTSD